MTENPTTAGAAATEVTTEQFTAVASAGTRNHLTVVPSEVDGVLHAFSINDGRLEHTRVTDHDLLPPRYVTGERLVSDVVSFLAELDRRPLNDGASTLWGRIDEGVITAIYDDHTIDDIAGRRGDRLTLKLVADPDWTAWHKLSGTFLSQETTGDYLEELAHTIADPTGAEVLEIINSIRATSKGSFESAINRSRGTQKLSFSTEVNASAGRKGELEIPEVISLKLRPWEGHPSFYDIDAWLRLRIVEGHLSIALKLKPTRQTLLQAWADLVGRVEQTTGRPVLNTTSIR
ncbi:hypothetical protein QLQ75_gp45 [Gordonia phage Santhid]|uniref:DUF2303 family protein n=1 Tax=Gordonia phage Santhid TaxID=2927281 RepID=A0AAE9GKJ3_9CAUD|nr:hypothetical protein QLQ75_gp45 [Gordonia phage Santhid]UOK18039.1 hypothetical protein SEA_SANTHID_45 [Gordonia phage Santhid]